ncbi:MAG: 2Fe-2S iron-sulfur cluster-binding protein [Acidobacteriota bacterium]
MRIEIDNKLIKVKKGETVLDAAEKNDIYIPHLCSHPELSEYGGCRMCIVEVEGIRGYPTACTTVVSDGMKIRTKGKKVREMRKEILQLILSEHPAGCLICKEDCNDLMGSIRKVGDVTGCRWCPKDENCELQKVVRYVTVEGIKFPVYYQDIEVEKNDPFFDRDYNLCIYCARCVRICEEHRKSYVIALNNRGKEMVVGSAFSNSHIEAECEFCGACVSVCPTGTLSEKSRKWAGTPTGYSDSVCSLCGLNCKIQYVLKGDKIIGTLPPGDPMDSGGDLCVKGRFCFSNLINSPKRVLEPEFHFIEGYGKVSWKFSFEKISEMMKKTDGKKMAFYLSPNLTNEEIIAVREFADKVCGASYVTSSVLTANLISYMKFSEKSVPVEEIRNSDAIISVFLRGNYDYAPATLGIKRAAEKGVPLYRIGWTGDNTSRFSDDDLTPAPGKELNFFKQLLKAVEGGSGREKIFKDITEVLSRSDSTTFVLGPGIALLSKGREILNLLERIFEYTGSKFVALNPYTNMRGSLLFGEPVCSEDIDKLISENKIDLLYIAGDTPFERRPPVNYVIHHSAFPPHKELNPDLILPAPLPGEISGTYVSGKNKESSVKSSVLIPGYARSYPDTFRSLAKIMGKKEYKLTKKDVKERILSNSVIKYPAIKQNRKGEKNVKSPDSGFPYMLIIDNAPHGIHNTGLSSVSDGLKVLMPGNTVLMNPDDAMKLGMEEGEMIIMESENYKMEYPMKLQKNLSQGFVILLTTSRFAGYQTNPCAVFLRRKNV